MAPQNYKTKIFENNIKIHKNSKYLQTGTESGRAGTTNPGVTRKRDNPLKGTRNPIPRKPDNPIMESRV